MEKGRNSTLIIQNNSSILTLPSEIISEIFILSLPRHFKFCCDLERIPKLPVLSTCRRWRAVALRTPQLWSRFSLDIRDSKSPADDVIAVLELWLKRAGNALLHIEFAYPNIHLGSWTVLLTKIKQWYSLEGQFRIRPDDIVKLLSQFFGWADRAINLRKLKLIGTDTTRALAFQKFDLTFPSLTSLKIGKNDYHLLQSLNAPNIVDISLEDPDQNILNFIKRSFLLVTTIELVLHNHRSLNVFLDTLSPFQGVRSWSLELYYDAISACTQLKPGTTFPLVTSLTLHTFSDKIRDKVTILCPFPNILHLTLIVDTQVLQHLGGGPCLKDNKPMPLLCPHLRSITLENCTIHKPVLLAVTHARAPPVSQPKSPQSHRKHEPIFERCLVNIHQCHYGNNHLILNAENLDYNAVKSISYWGD